MPEVQGAINAAVNAVRPRSAAESTLLPSHQGFLRQIDQLRVLEWNTDHLWDIRFPNIPQNSLEKLPAYFQQWLPVLDIDENLATQNVETFNLYNSTTSIPTGTAEFDMTLVFADDVNNSLLGWFANWINYDILGANRGGRVTPVVDSARQIWVRKLTRQKVEVETRRYWVIPEGNVNFNGKSTSDLSQYQVKLQVVGFPS
ncbi:hypothetical protein GR11A_00112 [Vibrio phage vB_VcorM_GR11A]|nr:hypothetical protein GR11A_00112 [Vibrio phage vB_VcorM_GR11A]